MENTAAPERPPDFNRGVHVRLAEAGDVEAVLDLLDAVATEGRWIGAEAPIDRPRRRERFEEMVAAGAMLVAVADGRIVGNIGLEDKRGLIDIGMMVADGYRGRGIGTALMTAALEWAKKRDAHKLSLQVWTHNEPAIALYEKFGFVREGHLVKQWKRRSGELWDAYVMGLLLFDDGDD